MKLYSEQFKNEMVVVDYLVNEYKKELEKNPIFYNVRNAISKERLKRLRLEIEETLKKVERNIDIWGKK